MTKNINGNSAAPVSGTSLSGKDNLSALIGECLAHSRSAQKKLYDLYAPAAYGVIKRFVNNNEPLAKELLNESFFRVFRDLHQFSFQGAFEGWIRRIIVRTISDHFRKSTKFTEYKEVQDEDAYIENGSVESLSHKELLKIIETLPDAQREIFNLFVFENYSHKEIAKLLNIKQNNCRWHLNDARRRLKEKINSLLKNERR